MLFFTDTSEQNVNILINYDSMKSAGFLGHLYTVHCSRSGSFAEILPSELLVKEQFSRVLRSFWR